MSGALIDRDVVQEARSDSSSGEDTDHLQRWCRSLGRWSNEKLHVLGSVSPPCHKQSIYKLMFFGGCGWFGGGHNRHWNPNQIWLILALITWRQAKMTKDQLYQWPVLETQIFSSHPGLSPSAVYMVDLACGGSGGVPAHSVGQDVRIGSQAVQRQAEDGCEDGVCRGPWRIGASQLPSVFKESFFPFKVEWSFCHLCFATSVRKVTFGEGDEQIFGQRRPRMAVLAQAPRRIVPPKPRLLQYFAPQGLTLTQDGLGSM
eukprot:6206939-Amphidinium_carterae.2